MKKSLAFCCFICVCCFVQAQDSLKIDPEIWARSRKEAFRTTLNDSNFVKNNSDAPFRYQIYSRSQDLGAFGFMFFASRKGDIIGPITTDEYVMLFKVIRYDSSYRVRLSHILLEPSGKSKKDTATALKKAEKYLTELKAGKKFEELVTQVSQDTATAKTGGDLGWFFWGTQEKAINEFIKTAKKNDMTVIQSRDGIHIFRVTEDKERDRFRVVLIPLVKKR